jgi:hypothetical protein
MSKEEAAEQISCYIAKQRLLRAVDGDNSIAAESKERIFGVLLESYRSGRVSENFSLKVWKLPSRLELESHQSTKMKSLLAQSHGLVEMVPSAYDWREKSGLHQFF